MISNVKKAHSGLFAAGLLGFAAIIGMGGSASGAANASAPQAPSVFSPQEVFTQPQNVSQSPGLYDNDPWIGASPVDGGVTIAWEQRNIPDSNHIVHRSNTSLGAAFLPLDELGNSGYKTSGNVRVASDPQGRRHVVWWQYSGGATCGHYARIQTNGTNDINEIVPGSCNSQKNTALAVGTDGVVNVLFGRDLNNIGYYRRETNGVWSVQNEMVPVVQSPKNITLGVSTAGVLMAAYVDRGPAHNDIFTTVKVPGGTWSTPEDISAAVSGNSTAGTHLPNLARDPSGGLRIAWSQITRTDTNSSYDDVFYREWVPGTGWTNQPIVQLTSNNGNSYSAHISVDYTGTAHIFWEDDTGRSQSNFQLWYARGQGRTFVVQGAIFGSYFGNAFQKEASTDTNPPLQNGGPATVHVAFGSALGDTSYKENYYSRATITGGSPTASPTPQFTPTPCTAGVYSDVHPSDYFYTPVRELSLRGIISGYSDCTFRPYNNITRGQASKVVVLASTVPITTTGGPHFRDVPTTDPFYTYIESAYNANVISGYSCGGVGEPCPGLYFRPNNNITRGQFSKVVVLAFNIPINTTGGPHFRDVPTTNAFYNYIETAYSRNLISGYNCGGVGEPCPGLYFRPNNNITRGQAAKIVYLARLDAENTPTPTATQAPPTATVVPTQTSIIVTPSVTITVTPARP